MESHYTIITAVEEFGTKEDVRGAETFAAGFHCTSVYPNGDSEGIKASDQKKLKAVRF